MYDTLYWEGDVMATDTICLWVDVGWWVWFLKQAGVVQ